MLPPELARIPAPEDRSTEYLHYRQFFVIWDMFDRVIECQALEAPQMSRDTCAAWLRDYRVLCQILLSTYSVAYQLGGEQDLVDDVREQIVKLLTTDWLLPDTEPTGGTCPISTHGDGVSNANDFSLVE